MSESDAAAARLRGAPTVLALAAATALVAGCGANGGEDADTDTAADTAAEATDAAADTAAEASFATADLIDPDGADLGTVEFTESDGGTLISVEASGLTPGFHGLHIHSVGECEPDSAAPDDPEDTGDFMSAGGHLPGPDSDAVHPDHAGDLPPLFVTADGTAELSTLTDRVDDELLLEGDGTAVIVHDEPDNLAHIPERYAPDGADEDTQMAGDGGDRVACGIVTG